MPKYGVFGRGLVRVSHLIGLKRVGKVNLFVRKVEIFVCFLIEKMVVECE